MVFMAKTKKELEQEKNLIFLNNIRTLLNHIDKGKMLNNPHIKEIWIRLDLLEKKIKNE